MLHISVIGTTTAVVVCLWSVSRFLRWCLYKFAGAAAAEVFVVTGNGSSRQHLEAFARNGRCQNAAAAAGVDDERRVFLDRAAAATSARIEFDDDSINI